MFQPKVLNPTPEPWFVRELKRIDPDLRVAWGYNRYFKSAWAIERKMPPERYFTAYAWILSSGEDRYVEQPIFDSNQPDYDAVGELIGYKQVGTRTYDLAPEYEWVMFAEQLDSGVLTEIKRAYAWNRNHSLTRIKFEQEQEQAQKEAAAKEKRIAVAVDALDEVWLETRKKVQFGYGETRNEQ